MEKLLAKEMYEAKMAECEEKMNQMIQAYNELDLEELQDGDPTVADIMDKIVVAISEFNTASWSKLVATILEVEPEKRMAKACEIFSYPIRRLTDKNIGDAKNPVMVKAIVIADKAIDLFKLSKELVHAGEHTLGVKQNWGQIISKFNLLLTIKLTQDVKAKDNADKKAIAQIITNTFDIPAEVKEMKFVAEVSGNKTIQALQMVIDGMFGDGVYKVTSHDVKYIEWQFGKKSRNRRCITCSSINDLGRILLNVGNKLVTGSTYEVESRHIK